MATEKKELRRCIIIAEEADDVKTMMQRHQPDEYKPSNLSKLLKDKNQPEFVDSNKKVAINGLNDYALLIEDENENIGDLIKASHDSQVLEAVVICKDENSAKLFIDSINSAPFFISMDFNLINKDGWYEVSKRLYEKMKSRWENTPVIGVTNHENLDDPESKNMVELLRRKGDSVYNKSAIRTALPNIYKDKYQIRLLSVQTEQLTQKLSKAQKDLTDLKKTLGIDLKTRTESIDFATLKDPLVGDSLKMKEVRFHVELAAKDKGNVLLLGETGTGKELVAKAIHKLSGKTKDIVIVNCAAIPETLIESELFGVIANFPGFHNKAEKTGFFEQAIGSTLFLDEIHHMSLPAQAKVLRAIDDRKFYKLGGEKPIELGDNTRIIAATKPNVEELIEAGKFLEDLFGRLNSFMPIIPPLSERTEDILDLVEHFLKSKKSSIVLTSDAKEILVKHSWKRNVREIRNFIFGLHNLYSGTDGSMPNLGNIPKQTLIEKEHIEYALSLHDKKSSDIKLIRQVIVGDETAVSRAAKKSAEPNAKFLLTAILDALHKFSTKQKVTLQELASEIVMPGKGGKGTAVPHLSTEFNKYKGHFKELMSSSEFSGKLSIAMKYSKLKKIITS